jgi:hypothetical protein
VLVALLCGAAVSSAQRPPPRALGDDSLRIVYWPEDRALAERTWAAAHAPLPLPGLPPAAARLTGTVVLAPSPALFDSLTGGAPEWSAGVAIPSLQRIILPAFASERTPLGDPIVAFRHEIAHLALHAYLPGAIPRWFDEGYATWVSGGWDESSGWRLRLALLQGRAPPLDSISLAWPRLERDAELAYLLSASAVRHLATRSGEDAFAALLAAWRREGSLDAALRSVYQMTPLQYEREWRAMVRKRYGWLLALSQVGVFWAAFALLILILGTLRRRRNRERLAALRAEEYMLPPPRTDGVDDEYPLA